MADAPSREEGAGLWRTVVTLVVCGLLVGLAAGATYLIYTTEPVAESEAATRRVAALVETTVVRRGTYTPQLRVLGLVEPARDIILSPRVSGRITEVEPAYEPGGLVEAGQPLLHIDPADFQRLLTARISAKRQIEAALAIEQGRQAVAKQEYELLGDEIDPANRSLVLREPQIESIRAQLAAAEAAVEQAKLDLERTTVTAPFAAQILSRAANVGTQVSPGEELARLVGVDEYWVMASVPLRDLRWITFPQDDRPGASAWIRHATAWEPSDVREGSVSRLIGVVDRQSRLARVLVTVPDPLARGIDAPPLILGTIVEVRIEGRPLENVVRLDRAHLRQNDTVWVMAGDALDIRGVEVAFSDAEYAYIGSGLEDGDEVVTTSLATVTPGLGLRRQGEATGPHGGGPGESAP